MGAGCYYTLPDNNQIRAYWLDVASSEEEHGDQWDFHKECLRDLILELPLAGVGVTGQLFYGKHYRIDLEPTYNGDGILINLVVDLPEYDRLYPLTLANLERVYMRVIKHVNKSTALRVAASGWTSATVERGSL